SAWTMPMATMISPMTMTTVEASMALNCTERSHHGTPKEDTYHQAFQPAKEIAMRKTTEATAKVRARGERIAICDKTTAPRAAITPAIPAWIPKWWVHLVGVNMRKNMLRPIITNSRWVGPLAVPRTFLSRMKAEMIRARAKSIVNIAKRRVSEPSTEPSNNVV